jgi:hypothetical protein
MNFRRLIMSASLATFLVLSVAAQSQFHRAEQDLEITYWLQDPGTHQFKISHDFTLTRVGQKYAHSFVRAGSAVNPDSKMFNADTGQELKTYTVTGKSVNDLRYYPNPTAPDSVVVQGDLDHPIAEGESVRIRVEETYTDAVGYTIDKDELVWKRTLGRPLNLVTLPAGWMLTSLNVPAIISLDDQGRVLMRFTNIRNGDIDVTIRARNRTGAPASAALGQQLNQVAATPAMNAPVRAAEMANASSLVTIRPGERVPDEELARIGTHNRALCDQTVTVAGLTPQGLALYVPPLGQQFMAKNSQNYPRMCLVEDTTSIVPGVPRYLLVYAYSESAFTGFQPVTRVTTSTAPVSGSATVRNIYGDAWNFTYSGTIQTTRMDEIEAPFVIRSRSLSLNAYDESSNIVSHRSITASSQLGGNGASAIGYNGAQLIALLWNNPSHLINAVLKDVQKDSKKYGNK